MTSIIAVWQSFLKQDKAQEGQKEKGTEVASYMEETNETNKEHGKGHCMYLQICTFNPVTENI